MQLSRFLSVLVFAVTGCALTSKSRQASTEKQIPLENVRLAQAQVGAEGAPVQGTVNFEQMPNSVIITFRLEGLKPKNTYRLIVQENQDCESVQNAAGSALSKVRANKEGIAENTFKTLEFSVSRQRPLLGSSVILVSEPQKNERGVASALVACGNVEPLAAQM